MISFQHHKSQSGEKPAWHGSVLAYLLVGLGLPLLNVLLALVLGMPTPFTHDGFSYLFMADTFALGRATNPVHPLADFFQTFQIIQHDGIYASKYFPGLGVQLLVGELLGHPIIGVWLTVGLFGVSLLFFLRQFFPPTVALAVSLICDMQFMVVSYFGHSYWGGSLMALAGIWTLGGAVLAVKKRQARYAWISAAGLSICVLTRPFEGFFYLIPLAGWQLVSLFGGRHIFGWRWNWRLVTPMIVGVGSSLFLLGVYNHCITGNWATLPYAVYDKYYTPYGVLFLGQHAAKQPNDSFFASLPTPFHQMRNRYMEERHERLQHFFQVKITAAGDVVLFLFPWVISWMIAVGLAGRAHWKNGLWQLCVLALAMRLAPLALSWSSTLAHYNAYWIFPVAVLCAFGLQWLLSWNATRLLAGTVLAASLAWLVGVYLLSFDNGVDLGWKKLTSYHSWEMKTKDVVGAGLEKRSPQGCVVFVRYGPGHNPDAEWVYNSPEIDRQKVIWAHDLGEENDRRLVDYYPERDVWRVIVSDSLHVTLEHWDKSGHKFDFVKSFS